MKIAVVGTGYVGLVTGTCFSETGNQVTCVDIDKNKVDKLSSGQITIMNQASKNYFSEIKKKGGYILPPTWKKLLRMHKSFFWHCQLPPVKMEVQILNIF